MITTPSLVNRFGVEKSLMVLITRLYFKTAVADDIKEFIAGHQIDWQLFYTIIRAHHIRPFIYNLLVQARIDTDDQLIQQLKQDSFITGINNLKQQNLINTITKELAHKNIKVIPYKGVTFASSYYKSPSLRESSDIDLLADKKSVKQLIDFFNSKQMALKDDMVYHPGLHSYTLSTYKDLSFKTRPDGQGKSFSVEIQWKLIEPYLGNFPDYGFFINGITNDNISDGPLKLQPAYDLICLASHHFIREPLNRFKFVIDAACLLQTSGETLDDVLVKQVMDKYNYGHMFNLSLSAINDLLGVRSAKFELPPFNHNPLLAFATSYPVNDTMNLGNSTHKFFLRMQQNRLAALKKRLRFLLFCTLPTNGDMLIFKWPAYMFPLVMVLRPFRLLFKRMARYTSG